MTLSKTGQLMIELMAGIYKVHREAGDLLNDASDLVNIIDGREGDPSMRRAILEVTDRVKLVVDKLKDRRVDVAKLKAGLATRLEIQ
jgi:hypothetical protein